LPSWWTGCIPEPAVLGCDRSSNVEIATDCSAPNARDSPLKGMGAGSRIACTALISLPAVRFTSASWSATTIAAPSKKCWHADEKAARNATRYAQVAHAMACGCSSQPTREGIRRRLCEKHYLSETGRCRLDSLRSAFAAAFSDGFEDVRLNELLASTDIAATSMHMLNREERAIHPVFLILLEWLSSEVDTLPTSSRPAKTAVSYAAPATDIRDAKRTAWLRHQTQCAGMGRKEIRHRQPALWVWLYRHDREWLVSNQVARRQSGSPKPSAKPSSTFASVVLSNANPVCRRATAREPLPSAYQTRLAYGMNQYLFDRAAEEFNGEGKMAQLPARREVFVARRLDDAISDLFEKGFALDITAVAREARLRISTMLRYQRDGAC
jgi:Tn7-like transposition protein D